MKLFKANVKDSKGKRGRVYFNAATINAASAHMGRNFKDLTTVSIVEIINPDMIVNMFYDEVKGIHGRIAKAFGMRQAYTARVQQLMAKKSKTNDELDELCLLHEYIGDIDKDLKVMREKVTRKQELAKNIMEMKVARTSYV